MADSFYPGKGTPMSLAIATLLLALTSPAYADDTYGSLCESLWDIDCYAYCQGNNEIVFSGSCPYPGNVTYGDHDDLLIANNAQCVFDHTCGPPEPMPEHPSLIDRQTELEPFALHLNDTGSPISVEVLMLPALQANGEMRANVAIWVCDLVACIRKCHGDIWGPDEPNYTCRTKVEPGLEWTYEPHDGLVEHLFVY